MTTDNLRTNYPLFDIIYSRDEWGRVHIEKFNPTDEFKKLSIQDQISLVDHVILEMEGAQSEIGRAEKSCDN